ncbi:MAG: DUF1338 domain-containing protein [Anaerolineae bacterium]|nr:DUF1338 domain-containing protein [Gloeobacterales cyanobacterium ES-bin-313]
METAKTLWEHLWERYRAHVSYARTYEEMISAAGGTFINDHIAFRSLRLTLDGQDFGIGYLAQIAASLGYTPKDEYHFPHQHLYARYYQHPDQTLPKLFISELIVEEMQMHIAEAIVKTVKNAKLATFAQTDPGSWLNIFGTPWLPPLKSTVELVNTVSQYGAWVLLHGYGVNHFTGSVNHQNTPVYPDIESTAAGLAALGVPMKEVIEGSWGSGLRQTATNAVNTLVMVRDDQSGQLVEIPWTYAYFEIAERGMIENASGVKELFQGFLGQQAKQLFEMTKKA